MNKLKKYATKSDLMNVKIKFGKERFTFNLFEETQIEESKLDSLIKDQPASYSFLTMLLTRLSIQSTDLEEELKQLYEIEYINQITSTETDYYKTHGKFPAQKNAEIIVKGMDKYRELNDKVITVRNNKMIIATCVRAFELRSEMLRTLSANTRKENNV